MPGPALLAVEDGDAVSDSAARTVRGLFGHPLIDATWSRYGPRERGPDLHVHHRHVDAFYVVEGELDFRVGPNAEPVRAPAGTFVLVPPNVVHTFDNTGDVTSRWLNFHAPSTGFLDSLRGGSEGWDSHDPPATGGRDGGDVIVTAPGAGERHERDGLGVATLGESARLVVSEIVVGPASGDGPRFTPDTVDSYFVLDGEIELVLETHVMRAGPGTWMSAPPDMRHGFRNPGSRDARLLHVRAPGG